MNLLVDIADNEVPFAMEVLNSLSFIEKATLYLLRNKSYATI